MSPVSVVMAVFNGRAHLPEQVQSILQQLDPADELIIIDDASSDGGLSWLQEQRVPNVRISVNPANIGVIRTFERGLALARNPLVFLSDQDDVWLPGKRRAFVAEFERDPRTMVVISDCEVIDAGGRLLAPSFMAMRGGFRGGLLATLWRNRFIGCAMAVRRTLLDVALPFPAAIPMHDMWLGALGGIRGRIAYLPKPYLRYRRHAANLTPTRSTHTWAQLLRWRIGLAWSLARRAMSRKTPGPATP